MTNRNITQLLHSARILVKKEEEIKKARGETFNVFSVLRMETKENNTHSNFLVGLLDPNGTHLMGDVFLKLFLEEIGEPSYLDVDTTSVWLEYSCGRINLEKRTGGRIDIYLIDGTNKSISIENKINAADQPHQIERYVNHNKEKNRVYYLTLDGKEPDESSRGELQGGEDYFTLSYKDDIANWLGKCAKEAVDNPILRETIKQYRLLIQKLTKTMDTKQEEELHALILSNYEAAEIVARNFDSAKELICDKLRNAVCKKINDYLVDSDYEASRGDSITTTYAQIWIKNTKYPNSRIYFGVEPFSARATENVFIGIFRYGDDDFLDESELRPNNKYWSEKKNFQALNSIKISMGNKDFIQFLLDPTNFDEMVTHFLEEIKSYFVDCKELIDNYLARQN